DDQRGKVEYAAESLDSASREAEECRQQSEGPVHRFKQAIEKSRQSDVERGGHETACEVQAKQGLMHRMLFAVMAASLDTTSPRMKRSADIAVRKKSK